MTGAVPPLCPAWHFGLCRLLKCPQESFREAAYLGFTSEETEVAEARAPVLCRPPWGCFVAESLVYQICKLPLLAAPGLTAQEMHKLEGWGPVLSLN